MISVYITLGLIAVSGICVFIILIQTQRIKNYKAENENLHRANREAASRLEHIRDYIAAP